MEKLITSIYNVIWSNWLVYLCLLSGVYFSLRTKFSQVRNLKTMVKYVLIAEKTEKVNHSYKV